MADGFYPRIFLFDGHEDQQRHVFQGRMQLQWDANTLTNDQLSALMNGTATLQRPDGVEQAIQAQIVTLPSGEQRVVAELVVNDVPAEYWARDNFYWQNDQWQPRHEGSIVDWGDGSQYPKVTPGNVTAEAPRAQGEDQWRIQTADGASLPPPEASVVSTQKTEGVASLPAAQPYTLEEARAQIDGGRDLNQVDWARVAAMPEAELNVMVEELNKKIPFPGPITPEGQQASDAHRLLLGALKASQLAKDGRGEADNMALESAVSLSVKQADHMLSEGRMSPDAYEQYIGTLEARFSTQPGGVERFADMFEGEVKRNNESKAALGGFGSPSYVHPISQSNGARELP